MMIERLKYFDSAEEVAQAVVEAVVQAADAAIRERGVFHLVLAGGTTPKRAYELLRHAKIDWQHVHVWFGDERCLPAGDIERNDTMADAALLHHVPIHGMQVNRILTELGAEEAARWYAVKLSESPNMDLVLLGMGEDGHTASLFPNNPALSDERLAIPVADSPKPPLERVTMGYKVLNAARKRIIMVTGETKRDIFERIQAGEVLPVCVADSDWYVSL